MVATLRQAIKNYGDVITPSLSRFGHLGLSTATRLQQLMFEKRKHAFAIMKFCMIAWNKNENRLSCITNVAAIHDIPVSVFNKVDGRCRYQYQNIKL